MGYCAACVLEYAFSYYLLSNRLSGSMILLGIMRSCASSWLRSSMEMSVEFVFATDLFYWFALCFYFFLSFLLFFLCLFL
ncbi:hypothetical protein DFH27DRAFT_570658 [Peziza echinospora]|nr:hypothetical protein DFH27DRAFT_570658 [Peziza echinospora]